MYSSKHRVPAKRDVGPFSHQLTGDLRSGGGGCETFTCRRVQKMKLGDPEVETLTSRQLPGLGSSVHCLVLW